MEWGWGCGVPSRTPVCPLWSGDRSVTISGNGLPRQKPLFQPIRCGERSVCGHLSKGPHEDSIELLGSAVLLVPVQPLSADSLSSGRMCVGMLRVSMPGSMTCSLASTSFPVMPLIWSYLNAQVNSLISCHQCSLLQERGRPGRLPDQWWQEHRIRRALGTGTTTAALIWHSMMSRNCSLEATLLPKLSLSPSFCCL